MEDNGYNHESSNSFEACALTAEEVIACGEDFNREFGRDHTKASQATQGFERFLLSEHTPRAKAYVLMMLLDDVMT